MDLKETAEKLRAQAETQSGRSTRWRFDDTFRAEVVAYVRARDIYSRAALRERFPHGS